MSRFVCGANFKWGLNKWLQIALETLYRLATTIVLFSVFFRWKKPIFRKCFFYLHFHKCQLFWCLWMWHGIISHGKIVWNGPAYGKKRNTFMMWQLLDSIWQRNLEQILLIDSIVFGVRWCAITQCCCVCFLFKYHGRMAFFLNDLEIKPNSRINTHTKWFYLAFFSSFFVQFQVVWLHDVWHMLLQSINQVSIRRALACLMVQHIFFPLSY